MSPQVLLFTQPTNGSFTPQIQPTQKYPTSKFQPQTSSCTPLAQPHLPSPTLANLRQLELKLAKDNGEISQKPPSPFFQSFRNQVGRSTTTFHCFWYLFQSLVLVVLKHKGFFSSMEKIVVVWSDIVWLLSNTKAKKSQWYKR